MPNPRVLLDANVLWSLHQRNLLLQIANKGVIDVHWTEEIIEEWLRNSEGIRERLEAKTLPLMRRHFPNAVIGAAIATPALGKTNAKDLHVAHSASAIAPSHLLTWNLKHFDEAAMAELKVIVQTPDQFLSSLFDIDPDLTVTLAKEAQANLSKSVPTWVDYLDNLRDKQNLGSFVEKMRRHENERELDVTDVVEVLNGVRGITK